MLLTDVISIAGLLTFTVFWTVRRLPLRANVMWIAVVVTIVAAGIGRWHGNLALFLAILFLVVLLVRRFFNADTSWVVRPFSGIAFLLLSAVAILPFVAFPVPHLPEPSGEYAVGVRDFLLIDESRKGQLEAKADEPRRLSIRVWYPATPNKSASPIAYASKSEAEKAIGYLSSVSGGPAELFSQTAYGSTNSYRNAAVIHQRGLPVVYFSHGYGMYSWQNSVLMEELASNGYIVFSVAHAYDSGTVLLEDGSEIAPTVDIAAARNIEDGFPEHYQDEFGGENWSVRHQAKIVGMHVTRVEGDRLIAESAPTWLADRLFVSESLAAGKAPREVVDLIKAGDFSKVGHMGMSFGGSVSTAICFVDPRCAAAANLDGGDSFQLGINAEIPVPLLMFHQDSLHLNNSLPEGNKRPEYGYNDLSFEPYQTAGTREDIYRVDFPTVGHLGFTDVGLYTGPPMSGAMTGTVGAETMNQIMNDFVLSFFDKHLREQSNSFPQKQFKRWQGVVNQHSVESVALWWNGLSAEEQASRLAAEKSAFELRDAGFSGVIK